MSWSDFEFKQFSEAENPVNQPFDEVYISVFSFNDTLFFVEHNEVLAKAEVEEMTRLVNEFIEGKRNPPLCC